MRSDLSVIFIVFLIPAALAFAQAVPSITNVTNAAIPALDNPPNSIHLAPRSMATIFGTNLADFTVSSTSPWPSSQGGTEVHLADDSCFDSSCDLVAGLIYVSATQINFLVPDNGSFSCKNCTPVAYRLVLLRDGQRVDNRSYMLGGPGRLIIDPYDIADYNLVFHVGFDCLFSYSLSDSASCGLSWSQGQHRAPLGAVTDALSGQLISSSAPVHQGQVITLWMTALYGGVTFDGRTGLQQQASPVPVAFGVAQLGKDIEATIGNGFNGPVGTFISPTPIWAGESPQFVGLDQVNVAFPTCTNVPTANTEKRYDAFITYTSITTANTVRIYLPFVVKPGDPDCLWRLGTTTTITASVSPSVTGQAVTFTAVVSPAAATGTATFLDGSSALGTASLGGGQAALTTAALPTGTHSITAVYGGDSRYLGSSSSVLSQTVASKTNTITTVSASPVQGGVGLTGVVSPSAAAGTVTFLDGSNALGSASLKPQPTCTSGNGQCVGITTTLPLGTHSITATYSGSANYNSSSSVPLALTGTSTTLLSSSNPSSPGQPITLTATISPASATGTVEFFGGPWSLTCGASTPCPLPILCSGGVSPISSGQVKCIASLQPGSYSIVAVFNSDNRSYSGSSSTPLPQTVNAH